MRATREGLGLRAGVANLARGRPSWRTRFRWIQQLRDGLLNVGRQILFRVASGMFADAGDPPTKDGYSFAERARALPEGDHAAEFVDPELVFRDALERVSMENDGEGTFRTIGLFGNRHARKATRRQVLAGARENELCRWRRKTRAEAHHYRFEPFAAHRR